MQKPKFIENEIYHIYNRGVEKRDIFTNDKDRLRFIHDLFEFNDENPTINTSYYLDYSEVKLSAKVQLQSVKNEKQPRKLLVEILAFCLMPNHFHLLLRQKREGGIIKFMQKIGTGYSMYFNKKYERVGGLFQGRFKAAIVKEEAHFIHLPFYIHSNPLDLIYRGSTSIDSIDWKKQIDFLENYRWSSFLDYIGNKNFPSVTSRKFLLNFFEGENEYKKTFQDWLKEKNEKIEIIRDIILE